MLQRSCSTAWQLCYLHDIKREKIILKSKGGNYHRSVYTIGTRLRSMTKTTKLAYPPLWGPRIHSPLIILISSFSSCCDVKLIHIGQPSWRYYRHALARDGILLGMLTWLGSIDRSPISFNLNYNNIRYTIISFFF